MVKILQKEIARGAIKLYPFSSSSTKNAYFLNPTIEFSQPYFAVSEQKINVPKTCQIASWATS